LSSLFGTKEIILGILTISLNIAVFWLWFGAMPIVRAGEFEHYMDLILPLGSLVVTASLFGLSAIFIKNGWIRYGTGMLSLSAPYLLIEAAPTIIALLIVSLILTALAIYQISKEYLLSVRFSLMKTLYTGIPLYFTVTAIILSVFFFSGLDEKNAIVSLLPKSALTAFWGTIAQSFGLKYFAEITPDTTLDELLKSAVEEKLKSQGIDLSEVPKRELTGLIAEQRKLLAKEYGLTLTGKEKVIDILYAAITQKASSFLGPYERYLPMVSAIVFFFALKTITFPLYYLTLFLTYVLMKILIYAGVLTLQKQQIVVERLVL